MEENIVIIHSDGTTDNRANFLESLASGRLRLLKYERSNAMVHLYGNAALLVAPTRKEFTYKGSPATDNDLASVLYVKEGAKWRMAAMQNTHRIP